MKIIKSARRGKMSDLDNTLQATDNLNTDSEKTVNALLSSLKVENSLTDGHEGAMFKYSPLRRKLAVVVRHTNVGCLGDVS